MENTEKKMIRRLPKMDYEINLVNMCVRVLEVQASLPIGYQDGNVIKWTSEVLYRAMRDINELTQDYKGPQLNIYENESKTNG